MRGQQAHWLARLRTRSREKAGKKMICTQCGKQNPEDARLRSLRKDPAARSSRLPAPRASRLPFVAAVVAAWIVGLLTVAAAMRWEWRALP